MERRTLFTITLGGAEPEDNEMGTKCDYRNFTIKICCDKIEDAVREAIAFGTKKHPRSTFTKTIVTNIVCDELFFPSVNEEEKEPEWKNGCAIFRFEDGSAMARFAGEPIVGIHRNRKRPVSLSFTKDFLAFITTEEEKELYDRWVISCHQALGKIPNEVCHAYSS